MATSPRDVFSSSAFPNDQSLHASATIPILIRAARQQDLPLLADVLARSFHSQDGAMGWMYPLLRMGIYEDLRNRLQAKASYQVCLVAVAQAEWFLAQRTAAPASSTPVAGTVEISQRTCTLWQPQRRRYLYVSNLAVPLEYRRQGVARRLLAACEQVAIGWKIPDLYLHVLENNHPARRLYYQAGYRLKRVDTGIGSLLLGQPRQLFLYKRLVLV